ncbi:probable calcium-binding protein CML25 [Euphorbia lathyris]|uniref:probable calcium-binding protein CML25 n=1 Tax=Euphorbia lathyris TaxID=212925 RepID=UPI0033138279
MDKTPQNISDSFATHFRQVFKQLDTDGDGKISSHELSELLLSLGYEKSEAIEEAEELVRCMDSNGDGFVELDQFIHSLSNCGGKEDEDYDYDNDLMDVFSVFDVDKNGFISDKELHQVLIRLGCDEHECSIQDCRKMIDGVDQDGDGFVDFQEFRAMMTKSMG